MLDIRANRNSTKWSRSSRLARILWAVCYPFFRWSPRPLWGWRRLLLRVFSAKIGDHAHIYPTVRISFPWHVEIGSYSAVGHNAIIYALGPIKIGERVTISQFAHLCAGTHDYSVATMPLLKSSITVRNDAWICADAFIGPDVHVGSRAVVGARAVVVRDVEDDAIVAGNPARFVKQRPPTS